MANLIPTDPTKRDKKKKDNFNSFDTPVKESQRTTKPLTEHLKPRTQQQAMATSDDIVEEQRDNATAHDLRLKVQFQTEAESFVLKTTPEHTPNQVKQKIGLRINVAAELLKLSSQADTARPKCNWPLLSSNWQDGSTIICQILKEPTSFDGVAQCDECGDLRHVFYSYARQGPWAEPEPVIGLCADCHGGLS